jgi:hypothetical protein
MADDIYIELLKMKAGTPPKVDKAHVKTAPVLMKKYAEKYINGTSGYTAKKKGKPKDYFIFSAVLSKLTIDTTKKQTDCEIVATTGPSTMKRMAKITRGAGVPDTSKGAADSCIDATMNALVKDAVKTLKTLK